MPRLDRLDRAGRRPRLLPGRTEPLPQPGVLGAERVELAPQTAELLPRCRAQRGQLLSEPFDCHLAPSLEQLGLTTPDLLRSSFDQCSPVVRAQQVGQRADLDGVGVRWDVTGSYAGGEHRQGRGQRFACSVPQDHVGLERIHDHHRAGPGPAGGRELRNSAQRQRDLAR